MPDRIIGLTGPVQSGKIQLACAFESIGWNFIDLNDAIYDKRCQGMPEYDRLQALMPGCIDAEGVETATFYQNVTPEIYQSMLARYIPRVSGAAQMACINRKPYERIVLSWEYLARLRVVVPLDRMLVFSSDWHTWYDRMRARARDLSGGHWEPNDAWLDNLVRTLDIDPRTIAKEVAATFPRERIVNVDTTPPDCGEENLRAALEDILSLS